MTQSNDTKIPAAEAPEIKIAKKLATVLTDLLSHTEWDSSLFLKTTRKKLEGLLNETTAIVSEETSSAKEAAQKAPKALEAGQFQAYILLYQFDSSKLQNWQYTIKAFVSHSTNRPTYRSEQEIRAFIRAKKEIERYGYIIVNLRDEDVYSLGEPIFDALGHQLINLKEGIIKLNNIVGFVHANKQYYTLLQDGRLNYQGERNI